MYGSGPKSCQVLLVPLSCIAMQSVVYVHLSACIYIWLKDCNMISGQIYTKHHRTNLITTILRHSNLLIYDKNTTKLRRFCDNFTTVLRCHPERGR